MRKKRKNGMTMKENNTAVLPRCLFIENKRAAFTALLLLFENSRFTCLPFACLRTMIGSTRRIAAHDIDPLTITTKTICNAAAMCHVIEIDKNGIIAGSVVLWESKVEMNGLHY